MSEYKSIDRKTALSTTGIISKRLPNFEACTIFDIGANVGQSAKAFNNDYPEAKIFSFEPVRATYEIAQRSCKDIDNVSVLNLGFGRRGGEFLMTNAPGSVVNRVVSDDKGGNTEKVLITTGDKFCAENDIHSIDYLKIDTEGLDLEVLTGFVQMLSRQDIALIEVEVGMNPKNRRHVPFEKIKAFLEPFEYYLFYIFDQAHDLRFSGRPVLRRSNMIFISEATLLGNNAKQSSM